jgi:hypothetical protein
VFFEKRQHAFRAIRRPFGQETVSCEIERAASMRGDESLISKCTCAGNSFDLAFAFPLYLHHRVLGNLEGLF